MKRNKHKDINGWLVLNKPQGITSNDAVIQTRKLFDANKNGHCGTLDPFAEGVLPIAFGEATKLISLVADETPKEYEFTLKFGEQTDTLDTEGSVVFRSEKIPSGEEIEKVIPLFMGRIKQRPPVYSAIKVDGKRAYELAREGKEIELKEREIVIYDLKLLEMLPDNQAKFIVSCSKGTYVRTLGKDIAEKVGSVGYLTKLVRTKCANFLLKDTILLENLKNMVYEDRCSNALLPLEAPLRDIADLAVSEEDAAKLRQGQRISPFSYDVRKLVGKTAAAFFDSCLVAIVKVEDKRISPLRVFNFLKKGKTDVD